MKKVLLICLAILCSLLVGCGKREEEKYVKYNLEVFDYSIDQHILVDKETGVQYIYVSGYNRAGLSVRLDANGKPMVVRK